MTGVFSEVMFKVITRYQRSESDENMSSNVILNSIREEFNGPSRHVTFQEKKQKTIDKNMYTDLMKSDEVLTLILMHQKALSMWYASWVCPFILIMDSLIPNFLGQPTDILTSCSVLCVADESHSLIRIIFISISYVLIVGITVLVWKQRMRKTLIRAGLVPSPNENNSTITGQTRIEIVEKENKLEFERLMGGLLSRQYNYFGNIFFISCCVIHATWALYTF